jgi:hypothetical protein
MTDASSSRNMAWASSSKTRCKHLLSTCQALEIQNSSGVTTANEDSFMVLFRLGSLGVITGNME